MMTLKRFIVAALTAMTLASTVACLSIWLRSYWVADNVRISRWTVRDATDRNLVLHSCAGVLEIRYSSTMRGRFSAGRWPKEDRLGIHRESLPRRMRGHMSGTVNGTVGFGYRSTARRHRADRSKHYDFSFPYWAPFIPLGLLSALLIRPYARALLRRRAHRKAGMCPRCGYDLRATPNRCPECGLDVQVAPPQPPDTPPEKSEK